MSGYGSDVYGVGLYAAGTASVDPPGVPTSVVVPSLFITETSADIEWAAPASGGTVAGYVVRLDGDAGTEVAVTPGFFGYSWTGLTPDTDYTLSVAAENGSGRSAFVDVPFHTLAVVPPPPGYYRAVLTLGDSMSWDILYGDAPAYGPTLPVSMGWSVPDAVDYFPVQPEPTDIVFDLLLQSAADLAADVEPGAAVTFTLYVDDAVDADPWQQFTGIVTQLSARATPKRPDGTQDLVVTVYGADDTMRLDRVFVGYTTDWPEESIQDRLERIAAETGLDLDSTGGPGLGGTVGAKTADKPVTALAALRDALTYAGSDNTSEPPAEYWGRYVYSLDITTTPHTIRVLPWERRLFPSSLVQLDGDLVEAAVAWTMIPQRDRRSTWALVDGTPYGTPDGGPPYVLSTNLVDTTPVNPSADTRDNLGESLLPDGSTQLSGWYTRTLRYHADDVPGPVQGLCAFPGGPNRQCWTILAQPVAAELRVNGEDYLAGTLTGARLVLAPAGALYVDLRLRPELLEGWDA